MHIKLELHMMQLVIVQIVLFVLSMLLVVLTLVLFSLSYPISILCIFPCFFSSTYLSYPIFLSSYIIF
jgi:hypothetical protein